MDKTTYSAAGLATALGVPRTTINDWLTRYENYIDSETIGKRKVYSANTLAVLQEVASLRDAGKSGPEIEVLLANTHGVKPEIAEPKIAAEVPPAVDNAKEPLTEEVPQLPAIKEIERSTMELAAFIADLRTRQQQSCRRNRWVAGLLVVIIVILAAAAGGLLQMLRVHHAERQFEYHNMIKNMEKLNADFSRELQNLEQARQQERTAAQQNMNLLKEELTRSQQARAAEVARLTEQIAADQAKLQAELLRQEKTLNEKSAAEKELLLQKMENDAKASQAQLQILQQDLKNANDSLAQLTGKLQKISEEQSAAAAAARAAQTAAEAAAQTQIPAAAAVPENR